MKATETERDGLTIYVMMAGNRIFFFFKIKKIWKLRGFCFLNLNFSGSGQVSLFGVDTS